MVVTVCKSDKVQYCLLSQAHKLIDKTLLSIVYLRVYWFRLDLLQALNNVLIRILDSFLLAMPLVGQPVTAEAIWHGGIRVVFTIIKNSLQLIYIPAREIVTVKYLKNNFYELLLIFSNDGAFQLLCHSWT